MSLYGSPNEWDKKKTRKNRSSGLGYLLTLAFLVIVAIALNYKGSNRVEEVFGGFQPSGPRPNETAVPDPLVDAAQVVIPLNRSNQYEIPGTINGGKVIFLVDTGASQVSVPASVAGAIGLVARRPQTTQTASGFVTVYQTKIDELGIGGIRLQNIDAHINPSAPSNRVLLGMSALKDIHAIHSGNRLYLKKGRLPEITQDNPDIEAIPSPAPEAATPAATYKDAPLQIGLPATTRSLKDCIKPGNVIDNEVKACMEGKDGRATR